MDMQSFGDENFEPKAWINKAWKCTNEQDKEVFVSNTISRLQLYMKQLRNSLDETTTQILASMSTVMHDASLLQAESLDLQKTLVTLERKVTNVEEQTGQSIESLQKIDQLKSRLESAASALREADQWAGHVTALEKALDSGAPPATLAACARAAAASLEALSDSPDYDSKRLQLEKLYSRLEGAVTSPLLEALSQMDKAKAREYACVLLAARPAGLVRAWRGAARARLAAAWRRLDPPSVRALAALLPDDAPAQIEWLTEVFECQTPLTELTRLYTDLLLSLDPLPTKIVSANLKLCPTPEDGLVLLTDLRRDIDEFVSCVRNVKSSKYTEESIPTQVLRDFGRTAYAPLRELLPSYTELQSGMFIAGVKALYSQQEDLLEDSRKLCYVADKLGGWLNAAHSRGRKIAGCAIYPFYLPSVERLADHLSSLLSCHTSRLVSARGEARGGVLSRAFPATLTCASAVSKVLDALSSQKYVIDGETSKPLSDLPTLLLDPEARFQLAEIITEAPSSVKDLRKTEAELKDLAQSILKGPVDAQLAKIPDLPVWSDNDALSTDLPEFSLSPQEYITEIGLYLMTLPQHLEVHASERSAQWQHLSELCVYTCDALAQKVLNIRHLDQLGTRRCLTDIAYLSSVVEDLGSCLSPALASLEQSMRGTLNQK